MTRKGKFDEPYGTKRKAKLQARHAAKKAAKVDSPYTPKQYEKKRAKRKAAEASRKHNRRRYS